MNDFNSRLTAMFDDVAAGIDPRPDFDAARSHPVPVVANGGFDAHRFRAPAVAAAAAVLVLGAGVAAMQFDPGDSTSASDARTPALRTIEPTGRAALPDDPAPTASPQSPKPAAAAAAVDPDVVDDGPTDTVDESPATVPITAVAGELIVDGDTMAQWIHGTAPDGTAITATSSHGHPAVALAKNGEWRLVIELTGVVPGATADVDVRVGTAGAFGFDVRRPAAEPAPVPAAPETTVAPAPPKPVEPPPAVEKEPEPEPQPIAFTSHLGDPYNDETFMKQVFHGTAPAGAHIVAASDWGAVDTTAGPKGFWEMRLILTGVPDGTVVRVEVAASTGGVAVYELVRHAPKPEPKAVEFTSKVGDVYDTAEYFKPVLFGTGTPGSVVVATSDYGRAEAVVGSGGHWELWYKLFDVPKGAWVHIQVTNDRSAKSFTHEVQRPAPEEPPVVGFTATAAFVECDSTPPYNEYWGTAPPGSTVTISSAYGGGQATANAKGKWEARVEFPEAPLGKTFGVVLTNSVADEVYEKPFKRVEPT